MATIYTLVETEAYREGQEIGTAYTSVLASFATAEEAKAELDHIRNEHIHRTLHSGNPDCVIWCGGGAYTTVEIIKSEIPGYTLVQTKQQKGGNDVQD